jgi:predicted homoserine dehydrogenase-like protein
MPAYESLVLGGLPIGLAHGVKLVRDIPAGDPIGWHDVECSNRLDAVRARQAMEQAFRTEWKVSENRVGTSPC